MTEGAASEMMEPERVGMLRVWADEKATREARRVVVQSIVALGRSMFWEDFGRLIWKVLVRDEFTL
jgi:hypothetical protein